MPKKETIPTILYPLKLPTVKLGQALDSIILRALQDYHLRLRDGDILCVASKVVSTAERRIVYLNQRQVSNKARTLGVKFRLSGQLAQTVLEEADMILGGVTGFLLTVKHGILTPNAGVDVKNSPTGTAILWPAQPDSSASRLRASLGRDARIGVAIVDSRITPLRLGTTGLTIGLSGFRPSRDERGKCDLYGRRVKVTQTNLADDLASSAHLLMGERDEKTGLVVIRNSHATMTDGASTNVLLEARKCLIGSSLRGI